MFVFGDIFRAADSMLSIDFMNDNVRDLFSFSIVGLVFWALLHSQHGVVSSHNLFLVHFIPITFITGLLQTVHLQRYFEGPQQVDLQILLLSSKAGAIETCRRVFTHQLEFGKL